MYCPDECLETNLLRTPPRQTKTTNAKSVHYSVLVFCTHRIKIKSPARGLTVTATSVHGLLQPTCNHNHKLLPLASAEIKRNGFWWYEQNYPSQWLCSDSLPRQPASIFTVSVPLHKQSLNELCLADADANTRKSSAGSSAIFVGFSSMTDRQTMLLGL